MRKLNMKLLIPILAISMASCGGAGFGFDVTADYPASVPVGIDIPGNSIPTDINPDVTVIEYRLNDVGSFADALDAIQNNGVIPIDNIALQGLSYEIVGVDSGEQVPLDEISIEVQLSNGTITIPLATGGQLANISKTPITLSGSQSDDILTEISNSSGIDTNLTVDVGTIPGGQSAQTVDFEFKLYFDVKLSVRNL